jgi:hypothetical protein
VAICGVVVGNAAGRPVGVQVEEARQQGLALGVDHLAPRGAFTSGPTSAMRPSRMTTLARCGAAPVASRP